MARQDSMHNATLPNRFTGLANELHGMIERYLTKEASVSLALSCRRFYALYPHQVQADLDEDKDARLLIMRHFEKHYPNDYICKECGVWHRRNRLEESIQLRRLTEAEVRQLEDQNIGIIPVPKCRTDEEDDPFWSRKLVKLFDVPVFCIHRRLVELIWRARTYGPSHGVPLRALRYMHTWSQATVEVEGVLAKDHLLMRVRVKVALTKDLEANRELVKSTLGPRCFHLETRPERIQTDCETTLLNIAKLSDQMHIPKKKIRTRKPSEDSWCGVHRCIQCPSEYHVSYTRDSKSNFELLMTRWLDLGHCTNDEGDEFWHALTHDTVWGGYGHPPFNIGNLESVRWRFEREVGNPIERRRVAALTPVDYVAWQAWARKENEIDVVGIREGWHSVDPLAPVWQEPVTDSSN